MDSITVKNSSGQVAQIAFPDNDPRAKARREIIEQRIARGELQKASGKSGGNPAGPTPVVDYHTGLRDEKGDLLKSVHGGGVDPDAEGDVLGQPSGSKAVKGAVESGADEPVGDSHPDAAPAAKSTKK
jgi:hypothetical protein